MALWGVRSANDARASHFIIRYTQVYMVTRVPVIPTVIRLID